MAIAVRQAGPAEFSTALPLLQRFFAEEAFATSPEQIARELPAMLADAGTGVFLAWDEAEAVGVATVTTSRGLEFGLCAEMEDLYVLPEIRNVGAGTALIRAVEDWCRAQGCTTLEVVVTPEGQAAHGLIGFYRTRGFEESGRVILSQSLA